MSLSQRLVHHKSSLADHTHMPHPQMEENMKRAQERDAVNRCKFYFRRCMLPEDVDEDEEPPSTPQAASHDHEYSLMTIDTIINGKVRC